MRDSTESEPVKFLETVQLDLRKFRIDQLPWLQDLPVSDDLRMLLGRVIGIALLVVAMLFARLVFHWACRVLERHAKPGSIMGLLVKYDLIAPCGRLFAALVALVGIPALFWHDPGFLRIAMGVAWIYLIWVIFRMAAHSLQVFGSTKHDTSLPIIPLVQAGQILLGAIALIAVVSVILDKSPLLIFSGLGAMAAVLMLVFKDPLLGLVAGLQLSAQDMIRLGDWIELPDNSANGTVIHMGLTTVKVLNFDKTISCIPPVQLVGSPFINWRGMTDAGGRRILRALYLDLPSVRFVDEALRRSVAEIALLESFVADAGGRAEGLTNSQLFRAYIEAYLRSRPDLHTGNPSFVFLVRHLESSGTGLPIQVYVFTKTTVWAEYEKIQADIFDHLFAMLPRFGLMAYQEESDFTTQVPPESLVRRPATMPSKG